MTVLGGAPFSARAQTPSTIAVDPWALARQFAPVLVFHPGEAFFPSSLLMSEECEIQTPACARRAFGRGIATRIGDYQAMSLARKLQSATLYFSVQHTGANQLVLEYWLYYLNNPYRIRGGLVPFRLDGSHAHDLERLVFVLEPSSAGQTPESSAAPQYAIRTVLASAHSVGVPVNRYDFSPGQSAAHPLHVLVELGSHAMAPDVNGDNVFTPAIDATGDRKFVWGIRDRGDTWARYDASYADAREPSNSVCLSSESRGAEGAPDDRCLRYRLAPVEGFLDLASLQLSAEERHVAFGRTGWFKRTFGDGGPAAVLSPSRADREAPAARLIDRVRADERALAVGFSNVRSAGALLAGARYAWLNETAYLPDLLADGVMMFMADGRRLYEISGLAFYRADAITKLLIGIAIRSPSADGRRLDWMAGPEFKVGRWRVRVVARNPHADVWIDLRVSCLF